MKIAGYSTSLVRIVYDEAVPGTHIVLQLRTDDDLEGIAYISKLRNPKGVLSVLEARVRSVSSDLTAQVG